MKYDVIRTTRFKRDYKRVQKRGEDMELLRIVVDLLRQGEPLPAKYQDHALAGNYKGSRECHVKPDWLLIYRIEKSVLVLTLMRTGTHGDLFAREDGVLYGERG